MTIEFKPLSFSLGAEVVGLKIKDNPSKEQIQLVREGFLKYGILLFREQDISREQHIGFSRLFGELDQHESLPRDRHPNYPELLMVTNEPKANGMPSDSKYTGQVWHSDMSFTLAPAMGSILRSIKVPSVGGDTMFSNMTLAYEKLSKGMQNLINDLHGVHTSARKIVDLSQDRVEETKKLIPPVAQPIVRIHPETGKKALYIGEKVKSFVGMTEDESKPLIDYLCRHASKPQFVYRHQWQANELLFWDNRCTMHLALGDYDESEIRHLERTTILGTPSGYILQ
jgi:taurine dioxygenase